MCAVSLQFKILCRRIDKNTWRRCKNNDGFTDGYTDGLAPVGISQRVEKHLRNCATITDGLHTSRSACMSEAWSVGMFTDGFVCTFIDGITVDTCTDGLKSLAGFLKFVLCEYQFITDRYYRQNLMPPTIINVSSVIPSEKLLYKTPAPPIWFIFSLGSSSSSPFLFSSPFVFSFWKRFYCFGGSFKHIKRYVLFFLYLCIFFILIMIIFFVFCVLCIVCR